jgi:hypothetical protein
VALVAVAAPALADEPAAPVPAPEEDDTVLSDDRGGWGVLIGWSSLVALHGATSVGAGPSLGGRAGGFLLPGAIDTAQGPAPALLAAGRW